MRKLLIIIGKLHIGGAEKITVELIKNMDKCNLNIYFLVWGDEVGDYENEVKKMGCDVIHMDKPQFPYIKYYRNLKALKKRYGTFDMVHSHMLLNNGINFILLKHLGVRKLISHAHSTNSNRNENFLTRIYEFAMKKVINKYATNYLACGQAAGEYLYGKELFDREGIIITNGVDFQKFLFNVQMRKSLRQIYGLEDCFVIGNIARLVEVKNHTFLLDIFSELLNKCEKARLVIIGDGEERCNIEKKIEHLKLKDKVILMGERPNVYELLNMLDIIVFPSIYEGVPVSLIEAQVNGLPCVVSNTVSLEVKISENVEFVSLNEEAAKWADIVLDFVSFQREHNRLLKKSKEYDISESSRRLLDIYNREI